MNAGDLRDLLALIAATVAPTALLTWLLVRKRPDWRPRTRAAIAASPVPLLVAILCVAIFVRSVTASRSDCGVDACGLAIMASTVIGGFAVVAYAIGLFASWLIERAIRR